MSPVWIDAEGKEHELVIAEKSLVVRDPLLGFDRMVVAGQPVPPELEVAYRTRAGASKTAAEKPEKPAAEKPEPSSRHPRRPHKSSE